MKRIFIIAIVLLMTLSSAAQTTKEVYVGYSRVMNHYEFSQWGRKMSGSGYGNGVEAGINAIPPITKPLALSFGLQTMYGWDDGVAEFLNVRETDQFIKFLVPVSLLCEIRSSKTNFAIEPFAGLDCSFYAYGKCKRSGQTYDWFDGKNSLGVNRIQFGWHIGANIVYKRYVFTMNFQEDFTNIDGIEGRVGSFHEYSNHWANIELRIGYRF